MEGNECYKFSTIRNYLLHTSQPPIRLALDVGANVGDISYMMHVYFPDALIHSMEVVPELLELLRHRFRHHPRILVHDCAVTAAHLFDDDLGNIPFAEPQILKVLEALPQAGAGWRGGSTLAPAKQRKFNRASYRERELLSPCATLDEIVAQYSLNGVVDLLKLDCEGCEASCLGCASESTLSRIRFIVGEYHDFARFHRVVDNHLSRTHRVNLIGDAHLGAFFAEPRSTKNGILHERPMRAVRPWLMPGESSWHAFRREFVVAGEERAHAILPNT